METLLTAYEKCVNGGGLDCCCLRKSNRSCCCSIRKRDNIKSYIKDQNAVNDFINYINNNLLLDITTFIVNEENKPVYDIFKQEKDDLTGDRAYHYYKIIIKQKLIEYKQKWLIEKNIITCPKYIERYIKQYHLTEDDLTDISLRSIIDNNLGELHGRFTTNLNSNPISIYNEETKEIIIYDPINRLLYNDNSRNNTLNNISNNYFNIMKEIIYYARDKFCSLEVAAFRCRRDNWENWCTTFKFMIYDQRYSKFLKYKNYPLNKKVDNKRACANSICLTFILIIAIAVVMSTIILSLHEIINK